jgi:methylenetetrahydrofolate dehydrogenase (NADP+)/methenyltetrahydrofolate cyclohydrolase
MNILEPDVLANQFREQIRHEITANHLAINVVGFLASNDKASEIYAYQTKIGCDNVGINFKLITTNTDAIWQVMDRMNHDSSVHGILVYYPIFGDDKDIKLRNMVAWNKDIEGLTPYWLNKLYANIRFNDAAQTKPAILPCTPLAIIKILKEICGINFTSLPFNHHTITIFNRSEVVGNPLAFMLSHDGATVYSFDVNGGIIITNDNTKQFAINRDLALKQSDIIITGVPSRHFHKIRAFELKPNAIAINFSHVQNFADDAKKYVRYYVPRIGALTVAMSLRNAVRLCRNYH